MLPISKPAFALHGLSFQFPNSKYVQEFVTQFNNLIEIQKYVYFTHSGVAKTLLLLAMLGSEAFPQLNSIIEDSPKIVINKDNLKKIREIIQKKLVSIDSPNPTNSFIHNFEVLDENIELLKRTLLTKLQQKHGDIAWDILIKSQKYHSLGIALVKKNKSIQYVRDANKTQNSHHFIYLFENNIQIVAAALCSKKKFDQKQEISQESLKDMGHILFLVICLVFALMLTRNSATDTGLVQYYMSLRR